MVYRLLRCELRFIVLPEHCRRPLRGSHTQPESQQRLVRHLKAGQESFPIDEFHAEVVQAELVNPIARTRQYRQIGEMPAHQCRRFYRRLDVVNREYEQLCFARFGRLQQIKPRCIPIVNLAAVPPPIIWTRFSNSGRHLLSMRMTDFKG